MATVSRVTFYLSSQNSALEATQRIPHLRKSPRFKKTLPAKPDTSPDHPEGRLCAGRVHVCTHAHVCNIQRTEKGLWRSLVGAKVGIWGEIACLPWGSRPFPSCCESGSWHHLLEGKRATGVNVHKACASSEGERQSKVKRCDEGGELEALTQLDMSNVTRALATMGR